MIRHLTRRAATAAFEKFCDAAGITAELDRLRRQLAAAHKIIETTEREDAEKLNALVRVTMGLSQCGLDIKPGEDIGALATRVALNRRNLAKQLAEHVKHAQTKTCWPDDCPLCFEHATVAYEDRGPPAAPCARCGSPLRGELCSDEACRFHTRVQTDPEGWRGHPSFGAVPAPEQG